MSTKTLMVCPECHYEKEDESTKICPICFMKYNKIVYLEPIPVALLVDSNENTL